MSHQYMPPVAFEDERNKIAQVLNNNPKAFADPDSSEKLPSYSAQSGVVHALSALACFEYSGGTGLRNYTYRPGYYEFSPLDGPLGEYVSRLSLGWTISDKDGSVLAATATMGIRNPDSLPFNHTITVGTSAYSASVNDVIKSVMGSKESRRAAESDDLQLLVGSFALYAGLFGKASSLNGDPSILRSAPDVPLPRVALAYQGKDGIFTPILVRKK